MIEALRLERKEWIETIRQVTTQYEERMSAATEARMTQASEMHALKGKITELILKVEALLMRHDRGSSD